MQRTRSTPRDTDIRETDTSLEDLIESLSDPEAHLRDVDEVQVLQTHISVLFFAGNRVYKLKKPIKLDFLDYTSIEDRRRYCEEEVRLNRRISPRMYLDVLPVTKERGGKIRIDAGGEIVDWVVEMVRLPADRMLDVLLEEGEIDESQLKRIAMVLAGFHDRAGTGPAVNQFGLATGVAAGVDENAEQLGGLLDGHPNVLPRRALGFLRDRLQRFPLEHRDLLERRVAQWRIREGHGDLHAGNICLVGDEVYVYDCIEFERGFRCGDVASDLAFLAMDMDHRGHPEASDHLVRTYGRIASDADLKQLLTFYKTHRALVRAKVELLTADDEAISDEERRASSDESRRYGQLAVGYGLPASLVLTCGLPATGKSHTAKYLAGRLGACLLRSDELRKEGEDEPSGHEDYGRGTYSLHERRSVYREMLERSVELLTDGRPVVADASFARRSFRRPFLDAAARLGIPCFALALEVPDSVARERIEERSRDAEDPSDADFAVYVEEKKRFEPPDEIADGRVLRSRGTIAPQTHCHQLQELMIAVATS